jgi:hypothetical protein
VIGRKRRVGRAHRFGDAEVQYLDPAVGTHHDVLGLDVSVHDSSRVRGRQRVGNRKRNPG